MGHIQLSRSADLRGGGAGVGEHPGEDGGRAGGRSGLHAAAGDRQAGAGGAGDECADVAACRDRRPTWRLLARARRACRRPGRGRDGLQRIRARPARRTAGDPGRDRGAAVAPARPLAGRHALVTSGPTHEPIDPVRYIANRSSGRQGHAIAAALAALGARVTLVSGPVSVPDPAGRRRCGTSRARGRCWTRARRRCRPISRCSPPPSPTGAWPSAASGQDQEAAGRRAAGAGTGAESRHPRHDRRSRARSVRAW